MILYASIFMWLLLIVTNTPAAMRLARGKGVGYDPVRWAFWLISALFLLFNVRWIVLPDSMAALNILRICSIILAFYLLVLVRYFKRVG